MTEILNELIERQKSLEKEYKKPANGFDKEKLNRRIEAYILVINDMNLCLNDKEKIWNDK